MRARSLQAVHDRHLDVHQHHVRLLAGDLLDRVGPVLGHQHHVTVPSKHRRHQLAVGRDIVGDQHAQRADARRGGDIPLRCCQRVAGLERQLEPEQAALAGLALQPDRPAHGFDQAAADREAKSAAPIVAVGRFGRLHEGFEQVGLPVVRNADPGVAHLEAQPDGADSTG